MINNSAFDPTNRRSLQANLSILLCVYLAGCTSHDHQASDQSALPASQAAARPSSASSDEHLNVGDVPGNAAARNAVSAGENANDRLVDDKVVLRLGLPSSSLSRADYTVSDLSVFAIVDSTPDRPYFVFIPTFTSGLAFYSSNYPREAAFASIQDVVAEIHRMSKHITIWAEPIESSGFSGSGARGLTTLEAEQIVRSLQ